MGFPIIQIYRANWCDLFAFKGKLKVIITKIVLVLY